MGVGGTEDESVGSTDRVAVRIAHRPSYRTHDSVGAQLLHSRPGSVDGASREVLRTVPERLEDLDRQSGVRALDEPSVEPEPTPSGIVDDDQPDGLARGHPLERVARARRREDPQGVVVDDLDEPGFTDQGRRPEDAVCVPGSEGRDAAAREEPGDSPTESHRAQHAFEARGVTSYAGPLLHRELACVEPAAAPDDVVRHDAPPRIV